LTVTTKTLIVVKNLFFFSYRLLLNFCYPVDEEKGSAKFDRDSQRLLVHLPIKSAGFVDQTLVGEETILRETTFTRTVFGKAGMDDEVISH